MGGPSRQTRGEASRQMCGGPSRQMWGGPSRQLWGERWGGRPPLTAMSECTRPQESMYGKPRSSSDGWTVARSSWASRPRGEPPPPPLAEKYHSLPSGAAGKE
eukprot:7387659-Prymnesium_polylepis.3